MEYVLLALLGLVLLGFFMSFMKYALERPFMTLIAIGLGIATEPSGDFWMYSLFWFFLFWLLTSRDGLMALGAFALGAWLGGRKDQ
ncbi:hypothetical protein [Pseudidiomarina salilacus]|jgi:predicted membrane-bound dolichyl-phosphate-mannose-protein mannosyltransferase|uniref:hypothetical protein n=1 Tax=Pseudidiomarina salilacus TaxID=3384452 RepID=UPI00398483D1